MLVGRHAERDRIRRLLAAAKRTDGAALVVRGEAGIGKTALLDHAEHLARGMQVLRARGVESEAELPYAGLLTLVRPVLSQASGLPAHQQRALTTALALEDGQPADPLAVCAATLGLVSLAAEHGPLVALVDDAHWLDRESGQAIAFLARRLAGEPIAFLATVRDGEAMSFDVEGVNELRLAGLETDEAAQLLEGRVRPDVARRLADETNGNPLALLELSDLLSDAQREGLEAIAPPLPVGPELERAFGRRLAALDDDARRALLVAAVGNERDALAELARAWAALNVGDEALQAAERARLVTVTDGRLRFRHPLVRAAAYAAASDPDRRSAHRAWADVLDSESDTDERAWHLALATAGPDERAAAELEAAARRAEGRSRHAALRAFAKAASLTPEGERRWRRLLTAAQAAVDAGSWDEAAALLDSLAGAERGATDMDEYLFLRATVTSRRDPGTAAAELLEQAAERLQTRHPDRAAEALVAATFRWCVNDNPERGLAAAERAASLAFRRGGKTDLAVKLSRGDAAGWLGRFDEAVRHWRRAAELVDDDDPDQLQIAGEALFSAGDDVDAQRVLRRAEALARERGALEALTLALLNLGLSQTRSGQLGSAHADALDCVRLMQAIGQRSEQAEAIGNVAWIEAMLGREAACRAHVEEAHALLTSLDVPPPYGAAALGLLELSKGRPDLAIEAFQATLAVVGRRIDADPISPRPILPSVVEALVRAGRTTDAARTLGDRVDVARSTDRPDAMAPLLRAQGLVDGDESRFREALAWHDRWSNRFERARTELCYGELLRRSKRRAEARVLLRGAVEAFDAVGARIWGERARAELAATGERARRRDPSTVDELTPQELQVARLVATGLTNREVAQRLFLSPKTIETHLGHVFRKTGVRTRAELAHRFRDSPDSIATPAS